MPIFEIDMDGEQFEVDAPDIHQAAAAAKKFKTGAPPSPPSSGPSMRAASSPLGGTKDEDPLNPALDPGRNAPWYSMRGTNFEKVGSEPGIAGENVYESPHWLTAAAASMLMPGGGFLPTVARAALGGAGGKAVEQGIDYAQERPSAPSSTTEALAQQLGAGAQTGVAEALGLGASKIAGAVLGRAAGGAAEEGAAPSLRDRIVNRLRSPEMREAAAHLQRLEEPHPLGKLEPHEQGSLVSTAEDQALRLRKLRGNQLYKSLEGFGGVSIRDLVDEAGNLQIPKGVEIPPEIRSALKAVQDAHKVSAAAGPGEQAVSGDLDMALSKLDDIPFTAAHELRKSISQALRKIDPRGLNAGDIPALMEARKAVQLSMEEAAQQLPPDEFAAWKQAEDFWRTEIAENHYRGTGRAISRKTKAGDPQKMSQVLEPFAPQDVTAAHKALVPGSWAPEAAQRSGQKAFDSLIEQRINTEFGARNASDKIDLTKGSKVIDRRIGRAAWEEMKRLASPDQAQRMASLEKVARAYERIEALEPKHLQSPAGRAAEQQAKGKFSRSWLNPFGAYHNFREIRPEVMRWLLEHPARVEVLTRDLDTAVGEQATQIAQRNVANVIRMFEMDSGKPPDAKPLRLWRGL